MQFLSISRRRTESFSEAEFAARYAAEIERARTLYAEGFIRQLWYRGDIGGSCILWEADSEADARAKLNSLPLAQAGMLEVTLVPLKPFAGFGPR
jgi:muconolactone delta-isomerase